MVKSKNSTTAKTSVGEWARRISTSGWESFSDDESIRRARQFITEKTVPDVVADTGLIYSVAVSNGAEFNDVSPAEAMQIVNSSDYVPRTKADVNRMFDDVGGWQYVKSYYNGMTKKEAVEWELGRAKRARARLEKYSYYDKAAALFLYTRGRL